MCVASRAPPRVMVAGGRSKAGRRRGRRGRQRRGQQRQQQAAQSERRRRVRSEEEGEARRERKRGAQAHTHARAASLSLPVGEMLPSSSGYQKHQTGMYPPATSRSSSEDLLHRAPCCVSRISCCAAIALACATRPGPEILARSGCWTTSGVRCFRSLRWARGPHAFKPPTRAIDAAPPSSAHAAQPPSAIARGPSRRHSMV